jgi:heme/copper-type cytochrome/quinol oxidase subunit 2
LHQVNVSRVLQTLLFISVVAGSIAGYYRYGLWGWDIAPEWLIKASFCHHGTSQIDSVKDSFLIASAITGGVALATAVFMRAFKTRARVHLGYAGVIMLIPIVLVTVDFYLTVHAMSILNSADRPHDVSAASAVHDAVCRPLQ